MWRYRNPVDVKFGAGVFETLGTVLAGRAYCLVTYDDANGGGVFADLARRVVAMAGAPAVTVRNIGPNPDFVGLAESCRTYAAATRPVEAIVALGGGSVMDAAKVLAAASGDFETRAPPSRDRQGGDELGRTPIIAVPTTAGTGSEVTSWATVWDTGAMKKYSLARETLYPEAALVDPLLTLGLPRAVTISTGLDALSHALESIWNVNANPVSSALAEVAAREVIDALPLLADDLGNADAAHPPRPRQPVRRPRLLQHPHRARPRAVLPPHAASRRAARHRLLVQPAHGDARRGRLRRRLRRLAAPHLRRRPAARRGAARSLPEEARHLDRTPPTTASTPRDWAAPGRRRPGRRSRTQFHRTPGRRSSAELAA